MQAIESRDTAYYTLSSPLASPLGRPDTQASRTPVTRKKTVERKTVRAAGKYSSYRVTFTISERERKFSSGQPGEFEL